jgi:hypothetical protein|tara:strand:+ start:3206 stop:4081 length:876 start_codon:yes stop_codon:yes gene_type:complete
MGFRKGYTIKPKLITSFGQVIFTDGTNDCAANQSTCEAYGYTYNRSRGVCQAYVPQSADLVASSTIDLQNSRSGVQNEVGQGSFFNDLNGVRNEVKTSVQNSLICGADNVIEDEIWNASVKGEYGKVLRQGEHMYGGGNPAFPALTEPPYGKGYFQASTIQLMAETSDETLTPMLVMGRGNIVLQPNSLITFEISVNVLEKATGNYEYYTANGAFLVHDNLKADICKGELKKHCGSEEFCRVIYDFQQITTGEKKSIEYGDIQLMVTGCKGVDLLHHSVMKLHETRTNTAI